jgi:hypothetical protein
MHPVTEMVTYLAGWLRLCKAKRSFGEQLGIETAQDIAADIVTRNRLVAEKAHKVETFVCEGLSSVDEATRPESEGGVNITPRELQRIRPHFVAAATQAHDATEGITR